MSSLKLGILLGKDLPENVKNEEEMSLSPGGMIFLGIVLWLVMLWLLGALVDHGKLV